MSIKAELMAEYPKGSPPPREYVAWHEWARAQAMHGLEQKKCPHCGLYKFPQEVHCPIARAAARTGVE